MNKHNTSSMYNILILPVIGLLVLSLGFAGSKSKSDDADLMVVAANKFLGSLSEEQSKTAWFDFQDSSRFKWHYLPDNVKRGGISLKGLSEEQKTLASALLQTGVSQHGHDKIRAIMGLEEVLFAKEGWALRDPELYHVSIFGKPSVTGPWGWKMEGHHLSLNFTVINGEVVATAPRFMGANPAEVREGPHRGLRVLGEEEDLARQLLNSFDEDLKAKVVFSPNAFKDIVTGFSSRVEPLDRVGVPVSEMHSSQRELLERIIALYLSSMKEDLAQRRLNQILEQGIDHIYFGWAGGVDRGEAHYYRIQGPSFLIEYDNVQNKANHQHTVWRDFNGDFGRDLLREHYDAGLSH
jgi:hypothetical protein